MIRGAMNDVFEFHQKMGVSEKRNFPERVVDQRLIDIGHALIAMSRDLESTIQESTGRTLRAHLTLEETGEWFVALGKGEEVQALDALADRLYTLLGDALTYDLPLAEAFAEVHSSNMTKTRKSDDPGRVRDKGTSFRAPNLYNVLQKYRNERSST